MHVSLRADEYDRVHELARREAISVPEVLRRGVRRALEGEDDDE